MRGRRRLRHPLEFDRVGFQRLLGPRRQAIDQGDFGLDDLDRRGVARYWPWRFGIAEETPEHTQRPVELLAVGRALLVVAVDVALHRGC